MWVATVLVLMTSLLAISSLPRPWARQTWSPFRPGS